MGVTLLQIARRSGVAVSTVSAALSPVCKKSISEGKMNEIRNVAEKMGYRPNLSARRLRTGKTFNVGVVIPSFLEHHPISTYFDLVSMACAERGYHAIPLVIEREYSNMPKQLGMLKDHHVDGLLFFDYTRQAYDQYLQFWQDNNNMVFRLLDPLLTNLPFQGVFVNHYGAGRILIEHVLSQGWTDLCFVSEIVNDQLWEKGYGRAWAEFSRQACSNGYSYNVIEYEKRSAIHRYKAIKNLIGSGGIKKGNTALILDGGDGSSGVYGALAEAGLVIGRDVAIASMNTLPKNEFVCPAMTVLSEPYKDIAVAMVEQLLRDIEGKPEESSSVKSFEPKLIPGLSTCKLQ
ncbi:MAG: LacI family DNA-binding transcriptional regulator [Sedimentisphaerales bacterium]